MKNKNTTTIIISIVLIIAAFFGGKAYGSMHPSAAAQTAGRTRGTGAAGAYGGAGGATGRGGFGGGATIGQVIAKDATSITISIPGGGSKIILYSPSTTVSKNAAGTIDDIAVGSTITAMGTANTDGSVTASAIQIRPAGMMPQQGAPQAPQTAQ